MPWAYWKEPKRMNGEESKRKEKEKVHNMVFKFKTGGFAEQAIVLSFGSRCVDRQAWGGHVQALNILSTITIISIYI